MDKQCGSCNWDHPKYEYKCEKCVTHSNWEQVSELNLKYTDKDITDFAEWMSLKGWVHSPFKKVWYNRFNEGAKTFAQLLSDFKKWKEANNG